GPAARPPPRPGRPAPPPPRPPAPARPAPHESLSGRKVVVPAALPQGAGAGARGRVVLLLSDCRATDAVDAGAAARGIDELVILAPAGDDDEARHLARESGARIACIDSVLDVPGVLNRMLADDRL
ncbi:MAG: hypothetical protein LH468_07920, partial [Nocardioides sp.]|nr:hypothetical protein [Nocardioides sp.]